MATMLAPMLPESLADFFFLKHTSASIDICSGSYINLISCQFQLIGAKCKRS